MEFPLINEEEVIKPLEKKPEIPVGSKAFSEDIGNDLLCPSQVYEYVELLDDNIVRYVGYEEYNTYEQEEEQDIIDQLFDKPVKNEETMPFEEQQAARIFG